MGIDGINIQEGKGYALCKILDFSDSLKAKIRSELASISRGAAHAASLPDHFSYKNTLTTFLESYKKKPIDTQKGMIGELLSHILMPIVFKDLTSLSVFLNKEESSIKKGFDIIYLDIPKSDIWYSEAKSGARLNQDTSDKANIKLLKRAQADIKKKFISGIRRYWDSALIDVTLVLGDVKGQSAKSLLSAQSPIIKKSSLSVDKNAILISILYECTSNPCSIQNLKEYLESLTEKKEFKQIIIFSIQKKTFEKVVAFLESEAEND